ncbi:Bax inhibitor-1/YccA family protein [Actinoplanes sp. NPDC049265]|uniref:Bax inhibitor-1/YccA family protein n=1 Tax=Actinoplanes sp. NPDC049265 TaxID=3363902 RepID=UPI00371DA6AB
MRTTTNPAIRSLLTSTETVRSRPGKPVRRHPAYRDLGTGRPLTIDDVVTRTVATLTVAVASAVIAACLDLQYLLLPAALATLGLGLFHTVRPRPSAPLAITYALLQGLVIGSATSFVEGLFPGTAAQAVTGTFAVFVAMLVVYRVRGLRLSSTKRKFLFAVGTGLLALLISNIVAAVLGFDAGLGRTGVGSAILSLVCICMAAYSLLLSFDAADRMIRHGVSADWSWYLAFGLVMALLWLYLEIVWLLTALR